jgi:putative ABC transport system permease protein
LVEKAIPMSFGDSYEGYRIVGTNHDYPEHYSVELSEGSLWNKPMEAVIGHNVAQELKLGIGDTFFGVHGLTSAMEAHDAHPYTIKGIFKQGNSVLDQLILTSLESVWHIHDHEEEAHHAEVENQKDEKEITAMLISFRNSMGMFQLPRMINENTNMQAAVPAYEVSRINNILGTGTDIINMIAFTIMIVAGVSIFISLYSNMEQRKYELAFLRTFGATRYQLVLLVLSEGMILTSIGVISGFFFSLAGGIIASGFLNEKIHFDMLEISILTKEIILMVLVLFIGIAASVMPSVEAFKVNISKTLSDE